MKKPCKICGNQKNNSEYSVREMMFGLNENFEYILCSHCGCLQIVDFPPDMSRYYPSGYYSFERIGGDSLLSKMITRMRNRTILFGGGAIGRRLIKKFPNPSLETLAPLEPQKNWRILDVGCGIGKMLYHLKETGFTHLLGVDPFNEKDITYSNGLKIVKRKIEKIEGLWDLITFQHSFEHMQEPASVLKAVHRLLDSGGVCLIRLPIVPSKAWERYRTDWVQLDAPRHFFLHSVQSLGILAENTGFSIEQGPFTSTAFQFWGSEQYLKGISLMDTLSHAQNPGASIFTQQQIEEFEKEADRLNQSRQGDEAVFYLKKKS